MIVEHRRVILRTPDENAKIGIVRLSHDNRRPNVTYALVIAVIDVRMSWALRPLIYHVQKFQCSSSFGGLKPGRLLFMRMCFFPVVKLVFFFLF